MQLSRGDRKVNIYKYTTIRGHLDVGLGASVASIKAYVNHAGNQSNIQIKARWGSQGFIHFNTDYTDGLL